MEKIWKFEDDDTNLYVTAQANGDVLFGHILASEDEEGQREVKTSFLLDRDSVNEFVRAVLEASD